MNNHIEKLITNVKEEEDKKKLVSQLELSNLPKEELKKIFVDTLYKSGVTETWKWKDVERVLNNTPIWKSIKGFQEKKNIFNEYITERKTRQKEDIKLRREKLRKKFKEMLEEDGTINSDSRYVDAITKFAYDERWRTLDERDREEMFQDYIDELDERENKKIEEKRKNQQKRLIEILTEKKVSSSTKWKEINSMLKDNIEFTEMYKLDQLHAFETYILALEKEEKNKKKDEEKYICYQNRDKFRDLLQSYLDHG